MPLRYPYWSSRVLLAAILLASSLRADFDPDLAARLQYALETKRSAASDRGIGAAVHIPGMGVWSGASGISHDAAPLRPDMRFFIGSVTKTFTAAAIMRRIDAGQIALQSTVGEVLPALIDLDIDPSITIEQLLSHRSGIFNYTNAAGSYSSVFSDPNRQWTKSDLIATFVGARSFAPGERYQYSNTNFIVLGLILEKLAGRPSSVEFDEIFFRPLGLADSRLSAVDDLDRARFAHGYSSLSSAVPNRDLLKLSSLSSFITFFDTAGGVYMSPRDLALWMHELFQGGVVQDIEEMKVLRSEGYGLGLMKVSIDGHELWGHGGLVFYHQCWAVHWPETGINIVVYSIDHSDGVFDYMTTLLLELKSEKLQQRLRWSDIPNRALSDGALPLPSLAPSPSMPVDYQLLSGAATIKGRTLRPTAPGRITLRARQAGNEFYHPAESLASFEVFDTAPARFAGEPFPFLYREGEHWRLALDLPGGPESVAVDHSSDIENWIRMDPDEAFAGPDSIWIYSPEAEAIPHRRFFRISKSPD